MDEETEKKIQELQTIEQNLQQILMQKQAFQMELNETETAEKELKNAKGDVYKIVGQIMVKSNKSETEKELKEKKDLLQLRLKAIEKQESSLTEKLTNLREEIVGNIGDNKKES